MPPLSLDRLTALLADYTRQTGRVVDILLIGGLALQAYGAVDRATQDVDGELIGELEPLVRFLHEHRVPADLGENISGWSVVAMPAGYRARTSVLVDQPGVRLRLLDPTDFVVAKLRRGTDLDLEDAAYVAKRYRITPAGVRAAGESAIADSPRDTAIFIFRKTVELFCARLTP